MKIISKIRNKIFKWFLNHFYEELADYFFDVFDEQEAAECKSHTDRLLNKIGDYIRSDENVYIICTSEFAEEHFAIQFGDPNSYHVDGEPEKPEKENPFKLVKDED